MNSESQFLHSIANLIATVQVSMELLLEVEADSQSPDPYRKQLLENAMNAVRKSVTLLAERRDGLKSEAA